MLPIAPHSVTVVVLFRHMLSSAKSQIMPLSHWLELWVQQFSCGNPQNSMVSMRCAIKTYVYVWTTFITLIRSVLPICSSLSFITNLRELLIYFLSLYIHLLWIFHVMHIVIYTMCNLFFFKFIIIAKSGIQRGGETGRSSVRLFPPQVTAKAGAVSIWSQEPDTSSSRSPTWVQGPKVLGHLRLLSQATGRELEGKRGFRDRTDAHMGSWACKARTLTTVPPCRALYSFF